MGTRAIQVGLVIAYRLRPCDLPRHPERLWHGRVEKVGQSVCWVQLLEEGYEDLEEMIFEEQIVGMTRAARGLTSKPLRTDI